MEADPLTVTFQALADPTRRAILAHLAHGEASVSDLAEPFDISLPAVSRHLGGRGGMQQQRAHEQTVACLCRDRDRFFGPYLFADRFASQHAIGMAAGKHLQGTIFYRTIV